jgi:ATP-dependent DNA helicase RecQ
LREIIPDTNILALTASATPLVAEDIMRHLHMRQGITIRSSFARPNISFAVRRTDDKQGQLLRVIENVGGSGIVYTRTREGAESVAAKLEENGIAAEHYHAGMPAPERTERQERWSGGQTRVMVATNAFGMGIDKADVRFVVHYDIPDSVEAYYQEAGRAGRDGKRSYAVLLSAADDRSRSQKRFDTEFPSLEKIKECYEALFHYLQIGIGDGKFASFNFNIFDFAHRSGIFTSTAINAIKILQQNGYMTLTDETDNPPCIMFIVGRDDLYKIRVDRQELDDIIEALLRLYTGLFHYRPVSIDIGQIAQYSGYTEARVHELLKRLWELRIIKYIPGSRSPLLILSEERLPIADVRISPESYHIRKQLSEERIQSILDYADNETECRSVVLRRYFGEENPEDCGVCDICLARKKRGKSVRDNTIRDAILAMLRTQPMTVKQIVERFDTTPERVIKIIDDLIEQSAITDLGNGRIGCCDK